MNQVVDLIQNLGKDHFFKKIALTKGYWQIPVATQDVHKTASSSPDGTYEFLRMPFGMVNSGATLIRGMRKLFAGMSNVDHCVDDILIHTVTWDQHVKTVHEVVRRLARARLTAQPSKTVIGAETTEFIGHQVGHGVSTPLEENLRKVREASRPSTKKEVRSFLGLTGYYREYVPNYAAIAVPLTDLTKKGQMNKVTWGAAQERAYTALKAAMTS